MPSLKRYGVISHTEIQQDRPTISKPPGQEMATFYSTTRAVLEYKSWSLNSGAKHTKWPLVRKTLVIATRNEVYYEKEGEDTVLEHCARAFRQLVHTDDP